MVSRHARCVKVDYANEFHIDVVPYVERHGEHYICNRDNHEFELTNPESFNEWLDQQDQTTGGKLIKVIRLLKYLRDYKNTFSVKSVILNILIGGRVNSALLLGDPDHYKDLPTAFKNLLADLNEYLQANPTMPNLTDPSCPSENFNHRCDQAQYKNLRKRIKYYSDMATAAFEETDRETSLKLWREIFGDDFGVASTTVTKATEAHIGRVRNTEQFLERDLNIPVRTDPRYRVTVGARVLPLHGFRTYDLQKHGNVSASTGRSALAWRSATCRRRTPCTGRSAIQVKKPSRRTASAGRSSRMTAPGGETSPRSTAASTTSNATSSRTGCVSQSRTRT